MTLDLLVDAHVHSTFSDGRDQPGANVATAAERGLHTIGLVDHVRSDTLWLPDFVSAVRRLRSQSPLDVSCGVEAKMLDTTGRLDVPPSLAGVDWIVAADHQVPLGREPQPPATVRRMIADGEIDPIEVLDNLLEATAAAAERYDNVLIAHIFSVLPKCGFDETMVADTDVTALGHRLARAGARVEISERWRCPSARVAKLLHAAGVELVASTDSHRAATIGQYDHVSDIAGALASI